MGIPSYYKTLTEKIPGIIVTKPGMAVKYLLFDFNCIVYNCLRTMRPYSSAAHVKWEEDLCVEVEKALLVLWETAGKPATVYIAVDGVVPMAKIKQQRMRRFKSVWWSAQELAYGVRESGVETWDKNAITPGTAFMERLGKALTAFCARRPGWTVSTSEEPGEGEHKVMRWIRDGGVREPGAVVIYGLDADLIVLSMLTSLYWLDASKNPCFLMREKTEFGQIQKRFADTTFLYLCVEKLVESLCWKIGGSKREFLTNYVAVMSLLGNDFLPHSLTLKINQGGHEKLLTALRGLYGEGGRFVEEDGKLHWPSFQKLFQGLASVERNSLEEFILKKKTIRHPAPRSETEAKMVDVQMLPVEWFVEKEFLTKNQAGLAKGWEQAYETHVPRAEAVREWKYGAQWIVNYYLGKPVGLFWFYPWHLPPLWKWLAEADGEISSVFEGDSAAEPLRPSEQLALVLPMESWGLLRDRELQRLPLAYPHMWPVKFGFATMGKWWMWECEADIPILLPRQLRKLARGLRI
jgi:5'-3' exonuclease